MQWLIQNSGIADTFYTKYINELIKQSKIWHGFGCSPDGEYLTGMEYIDKNLSTICFGSTRAMQVISSDNTFNLGVFYKDEWFDPKFLIGKRDDLLNNNLISVIVKDLKNNWIKEPVFIKSASPKVLNGQVIKIEEYNDWVEENINIHNDELLYCSPIHKIEKEWRFFVIDGVVITGSIYMWNGIRTSNMAVEEEIFEVARQMAKKFLPYPTITMDICLLRDGNYKLVEFNCLNSSGVYKSDIGSIIRVLEQANR